MKRTMKLAVQKAETLFNRGYDFKHVEGVIKSIYHISNSRSICSIALSHCKKRS